MVNTSKILTVSYGTFSCTLEGFDDSFETMKAIAEYFRDLASDDRYFGAEPPTPDAEMLARIAEREIARRVEAHEEQGKIVLRAGEAPALAAAVATDVVAREQDAGIDEPAAEESPAEEPQTEEIADAAEEVVAAEQAPEEEVEAPADIAVAEEPIAEEAAEETADTPVIAPEIGEAADATVSEESVEAPAPDVQSDDAVADVPVEETVETLSDNPVEDTPAVESPADEVLAQGDIPGEEHAAEDAPETVEEEVAVEAVEDDTAIEIAAEIIAEDEAAIDDYVETAEAFFENSPEPEAPIHYEAEALDPAGDQPEADSVAARLSRIRSVVSKNDQPYEQDDYSEDEHAQDFLNDAAAELDAALAEDDAAALQAAEVEETGRSDVELLASLASKRARQIDEEEAGAEHFEDESEDEDSFEDTLSQLLSDAISDDETPDVAAENLTEIDLPAEASDESAEEDPADEVAEASGDGIYEMPELSDDDETRAQLNARVVKVKREEFDAAIADSDWDEDAAEGMPETAQADDDMAADTNDAASEETVEPDHLLSPEQEEDLQRALAEVEADLVPEDAAQPAEAAEAMPETDETDEEADHVSARDGRNKLERADDQSDIERIFDEADSQLEKPESNQRRSAIQHLRAAVAATRAEKKAGVDLHKDVDDSPYRSDLASVVRPRRPSASEGTRSERPVESRPAPLKLVAEQRVDMERAPIRPRRVSASELAAETETASTESSSSFSDYARQMGATQLPDLLEAAAAYLSDVEGREQFSRPMLMHKIQEVEKENFAREDGLRSFGQLLREGKIQKIKGGRFTVTDETEFRDQARHAG